MAAYWISSFYVFMDPDQYLLYEDVVNLALAVILET